MQKCCWNPSFSAFWTSAEKHSASAPAMNKSFHYLFYPSWKNLSQGIHLITCRSHLSFAQTPVRKCNSFSFHTSPIQSSSDSTQQKCSTQYHLQRTLEVSGKEDSTGADGTNKLNSNIHHILFVWLTSQNFNIIFG